MIVMRSLKYKLLLWILPLCLVPMMGISIFFYFVAKERITEDRIVFYVEQIAQDIADTLQLTIREKREEVLAMSLNGEFRDSLLGRPSRDPQLLLNKIVIVHEVYDLIVVFDVEGQILLTNSINRNDFEENLNVQQLGTFRGQNLARYTPHSGWLQRVRSGRFAYLDWHLSSLVHQLYRYLDDDIARQYSIGFAAPIMDERGIVIGGVLALMNWEYIQEILDKVEEDLEQRSLFFGYAFMFGNDANTVIGHKYRRNRNYQQPTATDPTLRLDNYGTRLLEDHHQEDLRQAVLNGETHFHYQYPAGTWKISGLAPIEHEFFNWVCGVGINDEEIFAPVQDLKNILIWVSTALAILVAFLTYSVARQITNPIKKLTAGAAVLSAGDFTQRVKVSSRDEIGELAKTFNEMARSLEERSQALLELNRQLEEKVQERTQKLEATNQQMEKAYQELKDTQVQLVQSEKMASLGQLVAGIAHEIKNPLNFIYGNTDFLKKYVANLKRLIQLYQSKSQLEATDQEAVDSYQEEINYTFMLEDLDTLVRNFEEGAKRIHSIIDDLRTFSRMDSHDFQTVDIHETITLALNLLQNQYRDRIEIHREFGDLPRVECHPGRLSQVFMNLIANACQAIPDQGDVWIRTFSRDSKAVIEVLDNGNGIAPEHLGKVFEPFFTARPVGEGTGLGLSISYGIIQEHKGTIAVESEKGKGSVFRVELPLAAREQDTRP